MENKSKLVNVKESESNNDLFIRDRTTNNTPTDLLEEYGKLLGGEMVGDETVNRFEPVMADLLKSYVEMAAILVDLGVISKEYDGIELTAEILKDQNLTLDDEERCEMDKIRNVFDSVLASYSRRTKSSLVEAGHDEKDVDGAMRLVLYYYIFGKAVDIS